MRKLIALIAVLASSQVLAGELAPRVIAAPTLSEFGLIGLAGLVGVAAAVAIRRRK